MHRPDVPALCARFVVSPQKDRGRAGPARHTAHAACVQFYVFFGVVVSPSSGPKAAQTWKRRLHVLRLFALLSGSLRAAAA